MLNFNDDFVDHYQGYAKKLAACSKLINPSFVEQVINTQVALTFGDLAVRGKSNCYLGKITYDPRAKVLTIKPNPLVQGILEGKIDPSIILKEIFENG
jgi:hypothetical protein